MKIAVSSTGPTMDASVDPGFGRCPYFLVVDTDSLDFEVMDNTGQELAQGAGIQSARRLAERGVTHVLTGNCGPNAGQALAAAAVTVITGCSGTVRDVVEQFRAGRLGPSDPPGVPGEAGTSNRRGFAPGGGMGAGRGMGRGGRGHGRGRGQGMGRGRGPGRG